MLYRRTAAEMPAIAEEAAAAARDGVRFEFLSPAPGRGQGGRGAAPHRGAHAAGGARRLGPGPPRAHRRDGGPGVRRRVQGHRGAGRPGALPRRPAARSPGGWLAVGPGGATADEAVFVAGDLATGPATVVAAIARGREAADAVNARLGGGYALPAWAGEDGPEVVGPDEVNRAYFARQARAESPEVPEGDRAGGALGEETATHPGRRRPGRDRALLLLRLLQPLRHLLRLLPRRRHRLGRRPGLRLRLLQGLRHLQRGVPRARAALREGEGR